MKLVIASDLQLLLQSDARSGGPGTDGFLLPSAILQPFT